MASRIFPASHSRRSYGARSERSAYAVAERQRRLEASHGPPHLSASHSRRGYGTLAVSTSTRLASRRYFVESAPVLLVTFCDPES